MMFFVNPIKKLNIIKALSKFNGKAVNFHFVNLGATSWKSKDL